MFVMKFRDGVMMITSTGVAGRVGGGIGDRHDVQGQGHDDHQ